MIYIDTEKQATLNDKQTDQQQSDPCIWLFILVSVAMVIFYSSNPYSTP